MQNEQGTANPVRWYFYRQESGAWCWDAVAANGTVLARSSDVFQTRPQSVQDARAHGYTGAQCVTS
jgi:hypothetical protein